MERVFESKAASWMWIESRVLRAGTCLIRSLDPQHTNKSIQYMMRCKCGISVVALVHFDVPIACIGMQLGEFSSFAKRVDASVHPKDRIGISNGNHFHLSAIDTQSEKSVSLCSKHDRGTLFQICWFDDVYSRHLLDFRLFSFLCYWFCIVHCRTMESDVRPRELVEMLGDFDSAKAFISQMLKFFCTILRSFCLYPSHY